MGYDAGYYGAYFDWLCDKINLRPGTYDILIHELYAIDFIWTIDLDFNRAEDGIVLRGEYHTRQGNILEMDKLARKPCSVLEALIGLAKTMDFIMDDDDRGDRTRIWFWEMIANLDLDIYNDASFDGDAFGKGYLRINEIYLICNRWMNREFDSNGFGSPFPLRHPHRNQLESTMIDQMNDYILEKYVVNDEIL